MVTRIEPDDRVVVLARTIQAYDAAAAASLEQYAVDWKRFGDACLGRALYRHDSVFRGSSDAAVWSHLELTYFSKILPADVMRDLVVDARLEGADLLRAEILLMTPSSFILPCCRQEPRDTKWRTSIEYIDVRPSHLGEYRDLMRRYFGPAAAGLVQTDRIGAFQSMETAAVLHHDRRLTVEWNQIHLSEVDTDGFEGFGPLFAEPLQDMAPDGGLAGLFEGLDRMRTVPRWTLNHAVAVVEGAMTADRNRSS
ncbi:hypothetical protein ASE00_16770 [Sphingomonas sp. Root710]|uniref:hypothetical protein n=1 Tax=Sphingomonas sp. Root710 TaxID=1736594 RepID=UPI0006F7F532|nr:hypothetical protein [Sphingomonas sp. Root710]KRB80688.1 hypothetical protein ASE00_16770 [Sphingomonas sp. Root710]